MSYSGISHVIFGNTACQDGHFEESYLFYSHVIFGNVARQEARVGGAGVEQTEPHDHVEEHEQHVHQLQVIPRVWQALKRQQEHAQGSG